VEYVGDQHATHLKEVLKAHYEISEDWEGTKFAGMDLAWTYAPKHSERTCRITIKDYIANMLLRFGHKKPAKPQLSPHKHCEISYGARVQYTHEEAASNPLNEEGVRRIQAIVGAALFYGRAVDNKLLVALNSIGTQQASATEATNEAIKQVLDYMSTYPDDGILYRVSNMVLAAHSDAGFNNETKG